MSDWALVISVVAVVIAVPALIFAVLSYRGSKRIRQELDGSLGTPAVQINWANPAKEGTLPCRVTAVFNRVRVLRLKVEKEERTVGELARGEGKDLEFKTVPEGTEFKLSFIDPVDNRKYKRNGIIRYGQLDF